MSRLYLISAVGAAALALAACGDNADGIANTNTDAPMGEDRGAANAARIDADDAEEAMREAQAFVNAAGQASLVEIRTSEMAIEKSASAEVKAFAQKMIDDHSAANERLKTAALEAGLAAPPETLDDFHMRRINDLVEMDGDEDFDADYAALQVDAHNDAVRLMEDYLEDDDSLPQLKAFAAQALPTLIGHKAEAEKIRDLVQETSASPNPS